MKTAALKIQKLWYQPKLSPWLIPLVPLSWIYKGLIGLRNGLYQNKVLSVPSFPVPIIVIGNLTVGGTGKTPLVIHIARILKQQGMKVGIVSRGYLGEHSEPTYVFANSDPNLVGDEPVLLAKRLFCPIVVAKKRTQAVQLLLDSGAVDVILSDDGLQHRALERDIEIVVIDGKRRFGNGYCLPAGPLREPISTLKDADFIVCNTPDRFDNDSEYEMELRPRPLYKGMVPGEHLPLLSLQGQTVHAIAGIGFPDRFFDLLKNYGLKIKEHPFPDHYQFQASDINFEDDYPIIMTEKDAVKCAGLMNEKHWVLPVEASLNPLFDVRLLTLLQEIRSG